MQQMTTIKIKESVWTDTVQPPLREEGSSHKQKVQ